jgi:glycerophosphoryl diester phosphodiesterase
MPDAREIAWHEDPDFQLKPGGDNHYLWRLGHRGACGYAPENTLASIRKALDMGVHGFEFDIQLSKDGVPVVIHDATLERTTTGTGLVSDYDFSQLQKLEAGNDLFPGERIPSLQQVLDLVDKRCRLFIELKSDIATEAVVRILRHYTKHMGWHHEQLYVCSFDHLQLTTVRTLEPALRTCALITGIPVSLAAIASEAHAWAINPCIHHINQGLVDDAHRRGLRVITWTANHKTDIAKAKALGVDGIISNYPDRI